MLIEEFENLPDVEIYTDANGNSWYVETLRYEEAPSICPVDLIEQTFIFQLDDGTWTAVANTAAVDPTSSSREPDIEFAFKEFYRSSFEELMEMRENNFEGYPADSVFFDRNTSPISVVSRYHSHLGIA